jgi:hypothetical protein
MNPLSKASNNIWEQGAAVNLGTVWASVVLDMGEAIKTLRRIREKMRGGIRYGEDD